MNSKRKKILFLFVIMLLVLSGCARNTDANGMVLPEKMISLSTTFSHMIKNDSWFAAIFVWPIAQLINYLDQYVGVVWAVGIATIAVNVVILPLTIKSTAGTQKMQLMQPEIDKINKKYEGKTDQNSQMRKAQETQKLYEKHGINPFSTLLGTFATLPLIIAMWNAVQRAEAVAYGQYWGLDFRITPLAGFKSQEWGYVIIFIIMAVAQYVSMKVPMWLAEYQLKQDRSYKAYAAPKKSNTQNTTTLVMLGVILFISVSMPTAMSVYWFFSSVVNIVKSIYIHVFHSNKEGSKA